MINKDVINEIFKKDINILQAYNSILDDHLNKIKFKNRKRCEEEEKQQYRFITDLIIKGLNHNNFDIQLHPKEDVYVSNNNIFKSYILKDKTKNLVLTIVTSHHSEYHEKIYTTQIELQSDLKHINISCQSKECANLFKFITDYIFKNEMLHLLTNVEKQIYLFNYISKNTTSKKFVWRQIKTNKSHQLHLQTEDNKHQFIYYTKSKCGKFIINNDKIVSYKFDAHDSDKLKNIIVNSINSNDLDNILSNLIHSNNVVFLTNQNLYLEN